MSSAALIVAAGRGHRAGGGIPKQYRTIGSEMILTRSIRAMLAFDDISTLSVVIHEDDIEFYERAVAPIASSRLTKPVYGGATRAQSVRNGLEDLSQTAPQYVYIHDGARPFLSVELMERLQRSLKDHHGAFPAIPVADALWQKEGLEPVSRDGLLRAQTPQAFHYKEILEAHRNGDPQALDDVEIALSAGLTVSDVLGDERNFKVTTQDDLERADALARPSFDVKMGQGFDVHAFEPGDFVILNGVKIPFDKALKGHSDADVAMHALTDAIYGALAEGDIGQWFPPSQEKWKGAASDIFLKHAMERVKERGFQVSHLDCTIICEMPKIGPHALAMRESLAEITGLPIDKISVKATTSERLGFTGRGEGIASMATATLLKT